MPASAKGRGASAEGGGILFKLLVFLAVFGAFAALAWMALLPFVVCRAIQAKTGFGAQVERLVVNPLNGIVEARGLVLTNPETFPVRDFLDVRAFHAELRIGSLLSEPVVFEAMTIEVGSVTLVKRADGVTNVDVFRGAVDEAGKEGAKEAAARPPVLVHRLRLKVNRFVVVDYAGGSRNRREVQAEIDQTFTDVSDVRQLLTPAVLQPLGPVTEMLSRVPGDLGRKLGEAARTGAEFLKEAGRKTGEAVKGFFQTLEEKKKP
jgi:hypothetical protein